MALAIKVPTLPPQASPPLDYRGNPPIDADGDQIPVPLLSTALYLFLNDLVNSLSAVAAAAGSGSGGQADGSILLNVPGTIGILSDAAPLATFQATVKLTELDAYVKIAPDGADIIASLYAGATLVGTVTIPDGATSGSAAVTAGTVNAGQLLTLDITQVGTTFPGSDLSVIGRY